jgi:propanediol dehydratase small subunit
MQFDPVIHTKEFLLSNPAIALVLAEKSAEFATNKLASDFEILRLVDDGFTAAYKLARYQPEWMSSEAAKSLEVLKLVNRGGDTVAHSLAAHQSEWVNSEDAKSFTILRLKGGGGNTVAHWLAMFQSGWIDSEAAQNFDLLMLANDDGKTVAHALALSESEWISSGAAKSLGILTLADVYGETVAHYLVDNNKQSIHHQPIMQKQILTLQNEGKMLAEFITEKYKPDGMDVPVMAMKLISQGAAYKHSKALDINVGESLLKECKLLINDSNEPLIAFKQLQAAHSTFSHNVAKILRTQEQESLEEWQGLLLKTESLIRKHLNENPNLYDIEHTVDIFCEPGDDLLKKLQSERILKSDLGSLNELSAELSTEQALKTQNIY